MNLVKYISAFHVNLNKDRVDIRAKAVYGLIKIIRWWRKAKLVQMGRVGRDEHEG